MGEHRQLGGIGGFVLAHITKILVSLGALLFVDARTVGWLVPRLDRPLVEASLADTPEAYRRYVAEGGDLDSGRAAVGRVHARARARLAERGAIQPDGLDAWLEILRTRVDERIYFEAPPLAIDAASFAALQAPPGGRIAPFTPGSLVSWSCADGISEALGEALGEGVVSVKAPDEFDAEPSDDAPRIRVGWTASADGRLFGGPIDTELFPGIALTMTATLDHGGAAIASFEHTATLGDRVEYTSFGIAGFGRAPSDIVDGMTTGLCRRFAQAWIGERTGLAPPMPDTGGPSPADRCEQGDANACVIAAASAGDPEVALRLARRGCNSLGLGVGSACLAAAELELARGDEASAVMARVSLARGCEADAAVACLRGAELVLAGGEPDPTSVADAHLWRLRACDLGEAEGCTAAARAIAGDPAAAWKAALLLARACRIGGDTCEPAFATPRELAGVTLADEDVPFDLRWGVWFVNASAAEVTWIASTQPRVELEARLAEAIARAQVRVYAPAQLPARVVAPAGAISVYAVIAAVPSWATMICPECDGSPRELLSLQLGCPCVG